QNHPVVKQVALISQDAAQELRMARGMFDPKLQGKWDYKELGAGDSATEYWNLVDVGVKIPTYFPLEPKFGFERNKGDFINPENFISSKTSNQQIYAGFSMPIGKGLVIDKRRAVVNQAIIFQDMAEAEQIKVINKFLLTVAKDYWNWYTAYENYELMRQSIGLAQNIFNLTRQQFQYGEAAAMDTVQAQVTLQKRKIDFEQANIERITASLLLSNHLWTNDGVPLELEDNVIPEQPIEEALNPELLLQLVSSARENHPELTKLRLKGNSLEVERQLARENLKPQLDLSYVLLDQPVAPPGAENVDFDLTDNFKLGVDFSFPIFLRKERGKLNQVKFKIQDNNLELSFKEREVLNNINARFNTVSTTLRLIEQQGDMVENFRLIVQAERLNLRLGESDLFKLNAQLDKLIESRTKLIKLRASYQKDVAELYWAAGINRLGFDGN
ncbi:MAG: TolC family protein, partial [Bacteroidota bacterium]